MFHFPVFLKILFIENNYYSHRICYIQVKFC